MKKITIILGCLTLALSSCLKDKPNVDFSNLGTVVELVESGKAYFAQDAVTSAKDTIVIPVQVNIASPTPPTSDVTVGLAIDNSIIIADPAIGYITMPTAAYKLSATSVTVKAGQRLANLTLTIYKNQLDPSKSYQLPLKIATTTLGTISGNFGAHYYHIIGNDFAGTYIHDFVRIPAIAFNTRTDTFFPDSPTQFEVSGGYYTGDIKYVVSFTKTGTGATALYSNFAISLNADDVARIASVPILISTAPTIKGYVAGQNYTFAQALALFAAPNGFTYGANSTRINTDTYHK